MTYHFGKHLICWANVWEWIFFGGVALGLGGGVNPVSFRIWIFHNKKCTSSNFCCPEHAHSFSIPHVINGAFMEVVPHLLFVNGLTKTKSRSLQGKGKLPVLVGECIRSINLQRCSVNFRMKMSWVPLPRYIIATNNAKNLNYFEEAKTFKIYQFSFIIKISFS